MEKGAVEEPLAECTGGLALSTQLRAELTTSVLPLLPDCRAAEPTAPKPWAVTARGTPCATTAAILYHFIEHPGGPEQSIPKSGTRH